MMDIGHNSGSANRVKVGVLGLWHLGTVVAACLAECGCDVTGFDDREIVENLKAGIVSVEEPGLAAIISAQTQSNSLKLSYDLQELKACEVLFVTYDTPVDDQDRADSEFVYQRVLRAAANLPAGATVLISSQVPVGFTQRLAGEIRSTNQGKSIHFAYSPENLRLGQAINCFKHPERIIVGADSNEARVAVERVLGAFSDNFIWMSVPSAEMTKHALNAYLGLSIAFMNEVASICEASGADAREVEAGLKSEPRVGSRAPLSPGGAFAGGTLARDINFLVEIGARSGRVTSLLAAIPDSNERHKKWALHHLENEFGDLKGKVVAVLGLTYKPGTNTLRRSSAVEMCLDIFERGGKVVAYDPAVDQLPEYLEGKINLKQSVDEVLKAASAVVVATPCPEFKTVEPNQLIDNMAPASTPILVLDANGFLRSTLHEDSRVKYIMVGKAAAVVASGSDAKSSVGSLVSKT